jgi:DNA-binding response OmpR family regulator
MPVHPQPQNATTVLVVEDDFLIALDIKSELERAGYGVLGPANTVQSAMTLVGDTGIDAALLDVNLRNEKSYPVADALTARHIPFAFLSGHTADDLDHKFRQERMLIKPFLSRDLLHTVECLLHSE